MAPSLRRTLTTLAAAAALAATAAPAQADDPPEYVALGDSYTAAPLVPVLDVAGGCYRSTNNYPSVVAREGGFRLVDRSCSGADTADMTSSQLPGVPPQFQSLSAGTDLVTVSVGGNDESVFGTLVGYCPTLRAGDPTGSPCRDTLSAGPGRDRLTAAVARTRKRVSAVVRQARRLAPNARVLVVGYPQIAPRHGTCPDLLPLADGDYRYAVKVNKRLTDALRFAAHRNRATYVDVWRPSRGHDICADDPWINGQVNDPQRAQSFHPFANEQAAVAGLVLDRLG